MHSTASVTGLLYSRRFLPLFLTQFLGAFNDNLLKSALTILITYRLAHAPGEAQMLVTLAAGLFIAPFFLFSATAGHMADACERSQMARRVKQAEILLMALATVGFLTNSIPFLLFVLFCTGVQAAWFGPIKYALLPQHLRDHELITGNAYVESGTFLAILLGTVVGSLLVLQQAGPEIVSTLMLACAVAGYTASRFIPLATAPSPNLKTGWNIARETWGIIAQSAKRRDVFLCILGISWFWLVGATFLSQFPTFAKDVLHADETVVTLFLTAFSVGIGAGSFLCTRLLGGHVQSTYVPLAALGMSFFTIDLVSSSTAAAAAISHTTILTGALEFLSHSLHLRLLADLFLIAVCGGVYIVPLYALLQQRSDASQGARTIAANNIVNALFMVAAALLTLVLQALSFSVPQIFMVVGVMNGLVAIYICRLLPDALLRLIVRRIFALLYRARITGLHHLAAAGPRTLIIANHTSFLDALLLAVFLPGRITFAVNTHIARLWWMRLLLPLAETCTLDPTNPLAAKTLIDILKQNRTCMIFPEGRITVTGALMKIYEGPGMIADRSGAMLLPVHIDGAQYSHFSRLKGKVRQRWFPRITLSVLEPRRFTLPETLKGRARRQAAGQQLYDIMSSMVFEGSPVRTTLFDGLLDARAIHGGGHVIAEDIARTPITYRAFIARSMTLGRMVARTHPEAAACGILLPNSVPTALCFFGLHSRGKLPAMLNFSAGAPAILAACNTACIRTVITSRRFVEAARLTPVVELLMQERIAVIYLEDLRATATISDRLYTLLALAAPAALYRPHRPDSSAAAIILFTSGSEGAPKGVVLSHVNIQANRYQLASRIDFGPQDIVFNCLPMFHAFGLTGGTLLPLLSGIRTFFYPSPLHYRIVPELVYDTNASIFFGTDTFLAGYARYAHPYDFQHVRYAFAGAEKLRDSTRKLWAERFGVRILEGYGATETGPAISINTPMHHRPGSVGRILPGIQARLEPVAGIEEGGQLFVSGPNIMLGYLRGEMPGIVQPPADGWYDTGDIVTLDAEGYLSIQGRTKRFAKIGGEMVSLAAVEQAICEEFPLHAHAVVSIPDARKGEQLIWLSDMPGANKEQLPAILKAKGLTELALPRTALTLDRLPLLGTGKPDYPAIRQLALQHASIA